MDSRKVLFALLISFLSISTCIGESVINQQPKADFYVSTAGKDTWSGTLAQPNAGGTDGPFGNWLLDNHVCYIEVDEQKRAAFGFPL